ncbi:MAG: family 20 glycosylhydrolase [Chitinophagaceae bacterium]
MKKLLFSLLLLSTAAAAQMQRPALADSLFSTYYHQRVTLFKSLPQTAGDIVFIGNSITDGGEWSELFNDLRIKNRGISADVSAGIIYRIDEVVQRKPEKVFLMIGTNDLSRNVKPDSLLKNIFWITNYLRQQTPSTKVFVQSILPVSEVYRKFEGHTSKGTQIKEVNKQLAQKAGANGYTFIDLHTPFSDSEGKLKKELTNDGLHLNGEAYLLWKHLVYPYVYDAEAKPALIPQPQQVSWQSGYFPLHEAATIVVKDKALHDEAQKLQQLLQQKRHAFSIAEKAKSGAPYIELQLAKVTALQSEKEAYQLHVTPQKITITANSNTGIFYGIQTLLQLSRSGVLIDAVSITDWPAFSWRGYMVDVGRNYQSMSLLKEQIDVMAQYKLNIFHFHLTEDIAWRLQSKKYPQLTTPENMLRNKGAYYSERELKELIQYCRDRHITLVPEIDMPGHSEAFNRAMGFDMQSDSGLLVVKEILKEFCTTYNLPYLHIGGDEVKITNNDFLPEVTRLVDSLGWQTIGWEPGGNLLPQTVRQLWMRDGATDSNLRYIDSRHLYINHMDPLESVVTIYHRQLGDNVKEAKNVLGATLCLWHDRNVQDERDLLQMNPVYPSMLAFAERSWQGGGHPGWITNSSQIVKSDFRRFEKALIDHQELYFKNKAFPYTAQSDIEWKLYGPYNNEGSVEKTFEPENKNFDTAKVKAAAQATGGTVVLRHWFSPLVNGVVADAKENTTWYATTQIWSEEVKIGKFWIGFNNISRSPATDSPADGTWGNKGSKVWVNGKEVASPQWKRAGQQGPPEVPLTDEGYEYRTPAIIQLHRGWNTVLIKVPVASLKGKDWHNPVKCMFTFAPVE